MKVVRTYQQNFSGVTQSNQWSFMFNRIFKTNPKHKLMIRVNAIAQYDTGAGNVGLGFQPHLWFMKNFTRLQGGASTSYENDVSPLNTGVALNANSGSNNDFFLGCLGGGYTTTNTQPRGDCWIVTSPQILVDDVPMENMTIYFQQMNLGTPITTNQTTIFVSFEIDEVEIDKDGLLGQAQL